MDKKVLSLVENTYTKNDIDAMIDVLKSDQLTMGKNVKKFEEEFAKKFNFNYCVMVNSGSSANLLALSVLCNSKRSNYLKKGDRILVPSVCWSTSVFPILQNGLEPVFMDVNPETLNINAEDIEKYPNIRGIVLVHILGASTNMKKVMEIVEKNNLITMEDTCESLSSKYNDTFLGGFGDMGTYSFYFSHHMTTIEGGMITCKTKDDYNLLLSCRAHGWSRYNNKTYEGVNNKFCFINQGYNLRPMETQGAMGLNQLKDLDSRNDNRRKNYQNITSAILNDHRNYNIIHGVKQLEDSHPEWFAIALFLTEEYTDVLSEFLQYLDNNGIENRPIVTGNFTRQPIMKEISYDIDPTKFVGAEYVHNNGFYIGCPTHKIYNDEELENISNIIYSFEKFQKLIRFYKRPYNIEKSIPYVNDAIKSTWIAEAGSYVNKCEDKLKKLTGCSHVLLTSCGTSALHCMIKCLKYRYPECKKIYLPNNTYIAGINLLLHEYPMDMIECLDNDIDTLNIEDVSKLEKNAALFVIHNIGGITNVPKIKRERPDLIIFEDNAEGFLGQYEGKPAGSCSLASSVSFHMNKNITSGQGGAFCTNDKELFEYISCYVKYGLTNEKFKYKMIGNNYKMSNVLAAILLSQIEQIDEIIEEKKKTYEIYKRELRDCPGVTFQKINDDVQNSYWNMVIRIHNNTSYKQLEEYFKNHNIETRPMFYPLQSFEYLNKLRVNDNTTSIKVHNEYVFLPFNSVKEHNIIYICNILKKYIKTI